ncbi:MAG: DNA internalization-related competence protein ComEC/Rec2 [Gemmatimonadetes bacterium]|nr:DNA internalization-related competence protein ComEC/Rec2 [Gemmatimonadota bacterium]
MPGVGERWHVTGRLAPEPLRTAPGSRFPPPGVSPFGRRAELFDPRLAERESPAIPVLTTAERHLRERIAERFGPRLAPLATALLLGDRAALDPELVDAFTVTGTLHLLAVSGLHVAFLAGLIAVALRLAGATPVQGSAGATLLVGAYVALVGTQASVVRSAFMLWAVLWARAAERRVSPWHVWGLAAVLILAWRPLDLFDLGFVLSFASVGGLLVLEGPITRWLGAERAPATRPAERIGRLLTGGLAATTAASAGTLPVQAAAFGWIAPAGFLLNPVAVPLFGAGLPLAWLALAADALGLELLAGPLSRAAATTLGLLEALVAWAGARSPVWVPGPAVWGLGAGILLVAAAWLAGSQRKTALLLIACAGALVLSARGPERPGWEVVWLDVGQGDAIVLHFPDGATWLVDAGPADPFGDAGRRVVLPYLRRRGVRSIEWLITTHPDLDHVGGAASVVRGTQVRRWGSGRAVGDGAPYLELLAARGAREAPQAVVLRASDRLRQGSVTADVLHPTAEWVATDPYSDPRPPNEASVVLLLSHGRCRLLLTGDIGEPAEAELVRALGDSLRAGLLHAGHHGSRHSSSAAFLARVRPRAAVVSVGRRNRHGHPHPDALARLGAVHARVHRTDRMGSIAARCTPAGWRLQSTTSYFN